MEELKHELEKLSKTYVDTPEKEEKILIPFIHCSSRIVGRSFLRSFTESSNNLLIKGINIFSSFSGVST